MGATEYEEVLGLSKARMLRDNILVRWEKAPDEFAKTGLLRPETHKGAHFTGIVLAIGPDASPDLDIGQRIAFDQFSRFDKFWDEEHGRVGLLSELAQDDCLAIIPERGEITLSGVKPIGARILVKPGVKDWDEKGGMIVPGQKKVEVQQGEVIATGKSKKVEVVPGDQVLYEKYAGVEFEIEGVEYLLLGAKKIVGIVDLQEAVA